MKQHTLTNGAYAHPSVTRLTTLLPKMKVFLAMLMAVFAVTAAPTFPSSVVTSFKAGTIDTIMEDMCFDMSQALCATYGGYLQYGTFDPAATDGICTCSEQPSAYIVRIYRRVA